MRGGVRRGTEDRRRKGSHVFSLCPLSRCGFSASCTFSLLGVSCLFPVPLSPCAWRANLFFFFTHDGMDKGRRMVVLLRVLRQ